MFLDNRIRPNFQNRAFRKECRAGYERDRSSRVAVERQEPRSGGNIRFQAGA
jgi:hypothetical protein